MGDSKETESIFSQYETPGPKPKMSTGTKLALAGCGVAVGIGGWLTHSFTFKTINRGLGRGITLPYIPATPMQISNVLTALKYTTPHHHPRHTTMLDIGSGNGEICIETAKALPFKNCHGVEINRPLVWWSRFRALKQRVKTTTFATQDIWKYTFPKTLENVVIFGVEEMMPRLGQKFDRELEPGTRIVVCRFPLQDREPVATFGGGVDTVWLYFADTETTRLNNSRPHLPSSLIAELLTSDVTEQELRDFLSNRPTPSSEPTKST